MEPPTATPDRDASDPQPSRRPPVPLGTQPPPSEHKEALEPHSPGGPVGKGNYVVRQGEGMESIAFDHGFFWETLWNDPRNSRLKREREDPNTLLPRDEVYLREKQEKDVPCASERRHRFRRKGVPEKLIIHFKRKGKPRAFEPYLLDIDGALSEGETDENGTVRMFIPPNAKKGTLSFRHSRDQYELDLGHLDPITEISGVQGRLGNLGLYFGPVDGKMSEQLKQAIRDFQSARDPKKEPTGTLDEETRKQIQQAYGG